MTLLPQPAPTPATGDVWADVIAIVRPTRLPDDPLVADMEARRQQGIERYGTPLQVDNGRDGGADAYQEALDAIAYSERERQRWASVGGDTGEALADRWEEHRDMALRLAGRMRATIDLAERWTK